MEIKYKDKILYFNEEKEEWYTYIDNETISKPALKELKKYLDGLDKKGFKRIKVYARCGSWDDSDLEVGEITSITYHENGYGRIEHDIWITRFTNKKRSKHGALKSIYPCNKGNDKIMNEISIRMEKINRLEGECQQLKSTLKSLFDFKKEYGIK